MVFMGESSHEVEKEKPVVRIVFADSFDKAMSCGLPFLVLPLEQGWEAVLQKWCDSLKPQSDFQLAGAMEVTVLHDFGVQCEGEPDEHLVDQTASAITWMFPPNLESLYVEFDSGGGSLELTTELLSRRKLELPDEVQWFGRVRGLKVPMVRLTFPVQIHQVVLSHVQIVRREFKSWVKNNWKTIERVRMDNVVFTEFGDNIVVSGKESLESLNTFMDKMVRLGVGFNVMNRIPEVNGAFVRNYGSGPAQKTPSHLLPRLACKAYEPEDTSQGEKNVRS